MMYSEILAAKPETYYDNETQTTIGWGHHARMHRGLTRPHTRSTLPRRYLTAQGADGYTEAGTWLTYNDIESLTAITKVRGRVTGGGEGRGHG